MRVSDLNSSLRNNMPSSFLPGTRSLIASLRKQKDNWQEQTGKNMSGNINAGIISSSTAFSQVKAFSSAQSLIKGKAGVLKAEIELDQSRGASRESLKSKIDKLADFEERITQLNGDIGDKINTVNGAISAAIKAPVNKKIPENKNTDNNNDKEVSNNQKADTKDTSVYNFNKLTEDTSDNTKAGNNFFKNLLNNAYLSNLSKVEGGAFLDIRV